MAFSVWQLYAVCSMDIAWDIWLATASDFSDNVCKAEQADWALKSNAAKFISLLKEGNLTSILMEFNK